MRLLCDARLPQGIEFETNAAPAGHAIDFVRWSGPGIADVELMRAAAANGYAGVILLGRDSLMQPDVRITARGAGLALIAIATENPLEAKKYLLKNLASLRRSLAQHDCLVVLANAVRALGEPADVRERTADEAAGH